MSTFYVNTWKQLEICSDITISWISINILNKIFMNKFMKHLRMSMEIKIECTQKKKKEIS